MKTETSFYVTSLLQKPIIIVNRTERRPAVKQAFRSDLRNHRFAVIDNKKIGDPANWDDSWFTNYE